MSQPKYTKEAAAARGRELFEKKISDKVPDRRRMDFSDIDIDSGDFETGPMRHEVVSRLRLRRPEAQIFVRRVGVPLTLRL
jgi:hypothetical protein